MILEAKIQQEIYLWFHNQYCLKNQDNLIFSVPNESKSAREQMYKKSLGLTAGVSDLIVLTLGKCSFVEVKRQDGKQRDNQKNFEQKVKLLGFEYFLVRSLDDFKKITPLLFQK